VIYLLQSNSEQITVFSPTSLTVLRSITLPDYAPVPPLQQAVPSQEPGLRDARALPYELSVDGDVDGAHGKFRITFTNTGDSGAWFQVRSGIGTKPKHRGTLRALGLGRIGKSNTLPDRPEIRGMIARVPHLVKVEEANNPT